MPVPSELTLPVDDASLGHDPLTGVYVHHARVAGGLAMSDEA